MQRTSNKRDIQVILGMIKYYRQFIPLFSVTAQPLFNLLKQDITFIWAPDCKKAFVEFKIRNDYTPNINIYKFYERFYYSNQC